MCDIDAYPPKEFPGRVFFVLEGKFPFQDQYRQTDVVLAQARTQLQSVLTDTYIPEKGT